MRFMVTGKEGSFMLPSSKDMTPSEALQMHRSRNAVETAFRDLKHGVDRRPARCVRPEAIGGRIPISFLAQLVIAFVRFRGSELRRMTAELMVQGMDLFSLTAIFPEGRTVRRIYSNFNTVIRCIFDAFGCILGPGGPRKTLVSSAGT